MGAFYSSIQVRGEDRDAVKTALAGIASEGGHKYLLGPVLDGWIGVYSDHYGEDGECSAALSKRLHTIVLSLMVHDSDVFFCNFFRNGELLNAYSSDPDNFETVSASEHERLKAKPELFRDLVKSPKEFGELSQLLDRGGAAPQFDFEEYRLEKFASLLGIWNTLTSYEYLTEGERDGVKDWKKFIHIPDLTVEKNAKRALQARIKAEKRRLQKEGILLAEIKAPLASAPIAWGTDALTNGIIAALRSPDESEARLVTIAPPWKQGIQPATLKSDWTADNFCTSSSGRWLAGGFAYGDWKLRVWDWRGKEMAFEITLDRAVQWVTFSQDEQWLYGLGGGEFVVIDMSKKRAVLSIKSLEGARGAAVHPSGKVVVIGLQTHLGIIDVNQGKLVKKLPLGRYKLSFDRFPGLAEKSVLDQLLKNPEPFRKHGLETPEQIVSWLAANRYFMIEQQESAFDLGFTPDGRHFFAAIRGIRIFDWEKFLSASDEAPPPLFSVDAPRDNPTDPNSHPLAYCVRFDPERDLVLSSCLAGVIQYVNIHNGQSGTLLKLPDEVTVWRFELTADRQAICCMCATRPNIRNQTKRINFLQVWHYPALCKAAGMTS